MDHSLTYPEILTQVLRKASAAQPRLQTIQIRAVCDPESGQFLIIATGWEKSVWLNTILFHARLVDGKVVIEDDNFEEGMTEALITAGIAAEDIVTGQSCGTATAEFTSLNSHSYRLQPSKWSRYK